MRVVSPAERPALVPNQDLWISLHLGHRLAGAFVIGLPKEASRRRFGKEIKGMTATRPMRSSEPDGRRPQSYGRTAAGRL